MLRGSAAWEVSQMMLGNQFHEDKQAKGDMTEGICCTGWLRKCHENLGKNFLSEETLK